MQTVSLLLAVLSLQVPAPDAPASDTSARVVPLSLAAADAGVGHELVASPIDHDVGFTGTLHVWTRADGLDLKLRIEDGDGRLLAEDDDSGGGAAPYVAIDVEPGRQLKVRVRAARTAESGAVSPRVPELHLIPAPESAATRAAVDAALEDFGHVAALAQSGSRAEACEALARLVDELVGADEEARSERVAMALADAGDRADGLHDPKAASKVWRAVVKHRERVLDGDHPDLQRARQELGLTIRTLGDLAGARALLEQVVAARTRTLPADHVDLALARVHLADTLGSLGDLAGSRALMERALEVLARMLPEDDSVLQMARVRQSVTVRSLGDLPGAKALQEAALASLSRTLPADDTHIQDARGELATTCLQLGDAAGARTLFEQALEVFARTLPEDHPTATATRHGLALTLYQLGDLAGARALQEEVLASAIRTLPAEHPDLLTMRSNLAGTVFAQGDLARSRALFEQVLAVRARIFPDDHPGLAIVRSNLANVLVQSGELESARALQEKALEVCARTLPDDHPNLQTARGNLAITIMTLGDLGRARELFEKVLEVSSRTLPANHLSLQVARGNLASVLRQLGELEGARTLQEKVLEVCLQRLPADHPDLQLARVNLASTLQALGDVGGARRLLEQAEEVDSRTLPADHPSLQVVRLNLALALQRSGDFAAARILQERALEVFARTLPDGHVHQQRARSSLCWTLAALGEREPALYLAGEIARARRAAIDSARGSLAPRELEEQVAVAAEEIAVVVSLALGAKVFEPSPELARNAFALVESARSVGIFSASIAPALRHDPALVELRRAENEQSADLVRLAQGGAGRDEIAAARQVLDDTRRKRQQILGADGKAGSTLVEPTVERLSAALAPDQALVGYWRTKRHELDAEHGRRTVSDRLLAFVVRPGAQLSIVDLGPIDAVATAVERWRQIVVAPTERSVGGHPEIAEARLAEAGNAARSVLFDPLRPALGDARRVIVALDDVLHAIPLEALPDSGGVLGQRLALEQHLSLRELLWPQEELGGSNLLVALGGANFNAEPEELEDVRAEAASGEAANRSEHRGRARAASAPDARRAAAWERSFEPLTQTLEEARGIGALFEGAFETNGRSIVLEKRRASRESLVELAPQARHLHLATHGWFAADSIPSLSDSTPVDVELGIGRPLSLEQQVRGSSPMVLCGLALAGANLPQDQLGRVRGLITAEEIASLDLSHCDLAVLSACDTNVGVRRAGQGVASLQKALHMAGARSVITSLWKVPDEATKELMLDFYRRLWLERKSKRVALWEAKMRIRDARDERGQPRYTTRDWAAWVLTGGAD